uniref:3'-5' exonuclease n=1 Tax=Mycena chlorophos TaxID=658473 RepID=A0ABQ0LTE7_MYCCL|nr:predicted protein [Mycena chlorophos]
MFEDSPAVASPLVLSNHTSINNTLRSILDDLTQNPQLVVGFDSEWNVDLTAHGRLLNKGPPAVVQIAYKENIYILQIGEMLQRKALPEQLLNFLREPKVVKAGCRVNGDLWQLAAACGLPPDSFPGALDLACFAKDRYLVTRANMSLVDLVANILGQCLPKLDGERISNNWSDAELSAAQITYAARDAYASLKLYTEISKHSLPTNMTDNTTPGTSVLLLTDDNKKLAARGVISAAALEEKFHGINLTRTRTVVTVQEILIPGAIIGKNDRNKPLKDLGSVPFDVLAHQSHVRVVNGAYNLPQIGILSSVSPAQLSKPSSEQVEDQPDSNLSSLADDLAALDEGDSSFEESESTVPATQTESQH